MIKVKQDVAESKPKAKSGRPPKSVKFAPSVYINLSDTDHYVNTANNLVYLNILAGWMISMKRDVDIIRAGLEQNAPTTYLLVKTQINHLASGIEAMTPNVKVPKY